MTKLYSVGLIALMLFVCSEQASAQYTDMFSNMLSHRIWDSIYEQSSPGYSEAKKRLLADRNSRSTQASASAVTPSRMNSAVQFKSAGTRLMTQTFADGLADKYKQDKAGMREMLTAMLDRYDAEAIAKGLSNDLALAVVSYIALNRRAYNGAKDKSVLPFEQDPVLRNAVAEYAVQNGIFDRMTDRQRQEMYEALVMVGVFTHFLYEEARKKNDADTLQEVKNIAKQNLKSIGIKP